MSSSHKRNASFGADVIPLNRAQAPRGHGVVAGVVLATTSTNLMTEANVSVLRFLNRKQAVVVPSS